MSSIPMSSTGQSRLPSQSPATSMIPEETELWTDANETTQLLKDHHDKYDKKYTEPNGNVGNGHPTGKDGYGVITE